MADKPDFGLNQVAALAWDTQPDSLQTLREQVSAIFHCMQGPHQAYFEIPLEERMGDPDPACENQLVERFVYTIVGWRLPMAERGQAVHQQLIDRMWNIFRSSRLLVEGRGTPLVFWRREIEFDDWVHFPDRASEPAQKVKLLQLSCRVVIPGVNLRQYEAEWVRVREARP